MSRKGQQVKTYISFFLSFALFSLVQAKTGCNTSYSEANDIFQMCLGHSSATTGCDQFNDNTTPLARAFCLGSVQSTQGNCDLLAGGSLAKSVCMGLKYSRSNQGCRPLYGQKSYDICVAKQNSSSESTCHLRQLNSVIHRICVAFALAK